MKEKGKKERRTEDRNAFSKESCHIHVFRDALQTPPESSLLTTDIQDHRPRFNVLAATRKE